MTINGIAMSMVEKFKYLGSFLQKKGNIDEDVNHGIKVGWKKWKNSLRVLCDKRIPMGLKGIVYRMVVRLALLHSL